MTGIDEDQIFAGFQAVISKVEFDSSTATAGGSDGGNAGNAAFIPGLFYVNRVNDRTRAGISLVAPREGGLNDGDGFVGGYRTSRAELAAVGVWPSMASRLDERLLVVAGAR